MSVINFLKSLHADAAAAAKSLQSGPTLCDPIDDSPPGSPFPGILQARTLEWVAIYIIPYSLIIMKKVIMGTLFFYRKVNLPSIVKYSNFKKL